MRANSFSVVIGAIAALCCASQIAAAQEPVESPVQPKATLANFEVHPDFEIQLVASEPQIVDPVAIRFDEYGNLWVVEMRDYPHGPADGQKPTSRIKILRDEDADGFFETAHIFADNLLFATGVQPYNAPSVGTKDKPHFGVIVTLAGEVRWMSDTDGDFKADIVETWFSGFEQKNPQLRANDPTMGPDGWIYIANGLRNGTVKAVKEDWKDQPPVTLRSQDFRFDPKTGKCEAISGYGQFGMTFDDAGNRFVCSNRNPCNHVVLSQKYLNRNPFLVRTQTVEVVSPAGPASRVHAISKPWTTSTLHAGQFTAACGVTVYRGNTFPKEFYGNSFTCEPTGNLVHRAVLTMVGPTFTSKPGRNGVEFLASRDNWFRPVNLANAPDGTLYVVDMYRAVIEHPQFMPAELKVRRDLRAGSDRGRIYRVVPKGRELIHPGRFVAVEQAYLLESNGFWRDTLARLHLQTHDTPMVHFDAPNGRGFSEPARRNDTTAKMQPQRVGSAASFRELLNGDSLAASELVKLLPMEVSSWHDQAVLTLPPERSLAILDELKTMSNHDDLLHDLCQQIAMRNIDDDTVQALRVVVNMHRWGQRPAFIGLATGLVRRGKQITQLALKMPMADQQKLDDFLAANVTELAAEKTSDRLAAINVVQYAVGDVATKALLALSEYDSSAEVKVAAIDALRRFQSPQIAQQLLSGFNSQTPGLQRAIVRSCAARPLSALTLVETVLAKTIPASSLDSATQRVLRRYRQPKVKAAVSKALALLVPADRKAVLTKYADSVTLENDPLRGRAVFEKNCATCHRIGSLGINIAPDIADSRSKTPEYLLMNILDPNRAVDANYFSYTAVTNDGKVTTGLIASETSSSVTLKQAEGKTVTLLREDIDELKNNGVSLMPVGLEKTIDKQQMADLISFIKNWRYLDGELPIDLK
jgi:putative membrane-bound dehydrogenase-like protein